MHNEPLIAIVGPTASGKTGLAVRLARALHGEVISADSRQVYRSLDIGTEKITEREMYGVPHHCIDIASPRRAFSVEQWRRHAEKALRGVVRRGALPIVAGGTGFYVKSLVYGHTFPQVKPNAELRRRLHKQSTDALYAMLQERDPARAQTIEKDNPRRLIRALEIADVLGSVPPAPDGKSPYNVRWVGIKPPFEILEDRIRTRLRKALRRGLVAETKRLRDELGLSWQRIDELGLEYRTVASYIRGELPKAELEEKLFRSVRQYAKRQVRWLKRNNDIVWYENTESAFEALV